MPDYKLPRTTTVQGEVYINAQDLIGCIEDHKEHVGGGKEDYPSAIYRQAHNHIIELIQLLSSKL